MVEHSLALKTPLYFRHKVKTVSQNMAVILIFNIYYIVRLFIPFSAEMFCKSTFTVVSFNYFLCCNVILSGWPRQT